MLIRLEMDPSDDIRAGELADLLAQISDLVRAGWIDQLVYLRVFPDFTNAPDHPANRRGQ